MINVSAEFRELMQSRTDFKQYAEITLLNGAEWVLDETDFSIANNNVTDSSESNELPLGKVVGRTIQIEISNQEEQFKNVDFLGARIRLFLTFQLSKSTEKIELGTFTVITPETYGENIIVSATDDTWKLDTPYTTKLIFPQTIGAMFRDVCTTCGVLFSSAQFHNHDFVVDAVPPQEITNRQMIGYIAMIAGGNARFNRQGYLEIITYSFPEYGVKETDYDGGNFTDWTSGDDLDGGNFADWSSGDNVSGGVFRPWDNPIPEVDIFSPSTHFLTEWVNLRHDTENIIITGVKTTSVDSDEDGNELPAREILYGADGYVISIDNPLVKGKEETAVNLIGNVLVGHTLRKFEGDYIAYPIAEFMDPAVITNRKGEVFGTILTGVSFSFFGNTTMKNSAASPVRQSSQYNGAAAQAIIKTKELIRAERTQRQAAIDALNTALENSSGLYSTSEKQADGSEIVYLHDKPLLKDSKTVIKRTAEAIGISNDGGQSYEYGLFFNGAAVLRTLSAEGVNAGWIRTGTFTVADEDENITFEADVNTGRVYISAVETVEKTVQTNSDNIDATNSAIENNQEEANSRLTAVENSSKDNSDRLDAAESTIKSNQTSNSENFVKLTNRVEAIAQNSKYQINIINEKLENGVEKVTTTTGYSFGADGLKVSKSGSEMSTLIDDDGMEVARSGETVLTADSTGVNAINLTARQFLTIGNNSRFEDYKEVRTACFYIGG